MVIISSAKATNYYFSSVSGDDNRSANQAKNQSTPWKSLSKLNSICNTLQPGDNILFKRGETFYGSINISNSGTANSPIVFGAYGTGSKPVISGLVTLSNWVSSGKGIYECNAPALGKNINTVLLNNVIQQIGRYPNADKPDKGYVKFESFDGNTSITDNDLNPAINWTNAELVLRTARWKLDRYLITSQSGNTIYYKGKGKPMGKNYGYFIQNDIKTLDQFGEWYYDPTAKKVSMFFGSHDPSSYVIEAPVIDNLVTAKNISNIIFDNIVFKVANFWGITFNNTNYFSIRNCDILFSGKDGILGSKDTYLTIENCTVENSNSNGIEINSSTNTVVRNNLVKNTGVIAGMGFSESDPYQGIVVNGDNNLIEYNEVDSTGYIGIRFNGNNFIIKNNFVNTFCFVKDDGGGIYTHPTGKTVNTGRKITGNIVINGIGAPEGTNSNTPSAHGIYLDDNATNVEITNNTISNTSKGIYIHNASDIVTNSNTIYNNSYAQLSFVHDNLGREIRNIILTNNVFFSKSKNQKALSINTLGNDIDSIGNIDSNYYYSPASAKLISITSSVNTGNKEVADYDLDGWKSKYRKDMAAKKTTKQISNEELIRFEYNPSKVNKSITLDGDYIDPQNKTYSNSIVLQPYTSIILIKEGKGKGKRL